MTTISEFVDLYWPNIKLTIKQKHILELGINNNIIVQSVRQNGKTTLGRLIAFVLANYFKNQQIGIVSHNALFSEMMVNTIRYDHESIPSAKKCPITNWNKKYVEFSNGSKIMALPATESMDSFRGLRLTKLIVDEMAYIKNLTQDNWKVMEAALLPSGTMFITSTRSSRSKKKNLYWKLWCDAVELNDADQLYHSLIPMTIATADGHFTKKKLKELKKTFSNTAYYNSFILKNKPLYEV